MSYILEALRKVEQQREHLPAHVLSSRRRYYSAIDARFWSRPWVLAIAAIAGASILFWAFAYNTALIPVAAGVLYPFFAIMFRPEFAGLAMALSSVTVVTLSSLLRGYVPPAQEVRRLGN